MDDRVAVFEGFPWQAAHHQERLEALGFDVVNVALATSGAQLLYVSKARAKEAADAIAAEVVRVEDRLRVARAAAVERADLAALGVLGRRVRLVAFSIIGAPAGAVLGLVYLGQVRRAGVRPADHGDTLLAWWGCLVLTPAVVLTSYFYLG